MGEPSRAIKVMTIVQMLKKNEGHRNLKSAVGKAGGWGKHSKFRLKWKFGTKLGTNWLKLANWIYNTRFAQKSLINVKNKKMVKKP